MSKTHYRKLMDNKHLGSWDLMDEKGNVHDRIVHIESVDSDKVYDEDIDSEKKVVVLHFKEDLKPMVVNHKNSTTLTALFGHFAEDWVGGKIVLTTAKTKFDGVVTDGLRIKEYKEPITPAKLKALFKKKKAKLRPKEITGIQRVIDNQEESNYEKAWNLMNKK